MASSIAEYVHFKSDGIWKYFLRIKVDGKFGEKAKCNECKKFLACTGGSTKGLHDHLARHGNNIRKRQSNSETSTDVSHQGSVVKKQYTGPMSKFVKPKYDNSLSATIARMVSCDGLSFRVFITSSDIRRGLEAQGFSPLPKSQETIKAMVIKHGMIVKGVVRDEMAKLKKEGERFSLTFDEWTSTRNRRYMNINVHATGGKFWSLGMVRVHGSMPAEKCVELLKNKLSQFELSLDDDIVAITTDGASVMRKVGSLIAPEQQLCYAHGIQLAVLDVLYKRSNKRFTAEPEENDECLESDEEADNDNINDEPYDECDVDDNNDSSDMKFEIVYETEELITDLSDSYQDIVDRIRKIVKLFRRSPTKNDVLQKYVTNEIGHELNVILDCKTRWNSLFDMLKRFLKLKNCILKAMIDVKSSIQLSDSDIRVTEEIVAALEPVKIAVEALCQRDVNLVSADAALKFAVATIEKQSSDLAAALASAVRSRIAERRNDFAGALVYLNNPKSVLNDETFSIPKSSTIRKIVLSLNVRLDHASSATSSADDDNDDDDLTANSDMPTENAQDSQEHKEPKETSLKEQMQQVVFSILPIYYCTIYKFH